MQIQLQSGLNSGWSQESWRVAAQWALSNTVRSIYLLLNIYSAINAHPAFEVSVNLWALCVVFSMEIEELTTNNENYI